MRPIFHPSLVNGRCGDPTVYVKTLFEKRGLLFDLGEIAALPPRKLQRIDQIFVSHAHIDHFIGFDHLLRLLVGRETSVHLYGPFGLAEHVYHKLQGYRWDLVEGYGCELIFIVNELRTTQSILTTQFRLRRAFAAGPSVSRATCDGVLCDEPSFRVQRRSLSITLTRPASVFRCRRQPMSTSGRTGSWSAGFRWVHGCVRSSAPSSKVARMII